MLGPDAGRNSRLEKVHIENLRDTLLGNGDRREGKGNNRGIAAWQRPAICAANGRHNGRRHRARGYRNWGIDTLLPRLLVFFVTLKRPAVSLQNERRC